MVSVTPMEPMLTESQDRRFSGMSQDSAGPPVAKRRRANTDDEALFLLEGEDAARVQAAIEASLHGDMQRRLGGSLQETCRDIQANFPEEASAAGAGDGFRGARRRATSELSDFVRSLDPTPRPSPGLGAVSEPPAGMDDDSKPMQLEPAACLGLADQSQMYEHDGLLDHEQLMMAIYASQGLDFTAVQGQAHAFLKELGLRPHDMGVTNFDEKGNMLLNQCFYLSLSRGYLGHDATQGETLELALRLKRAIEAAVLVERPSWVGGDDINGEAMAFADFLPLAMKASKEETSEIDFLAELAVCILDSTAGHVEVYLGSRYSELTDNEAMERNLVLLWYTPGHYQCLVNDDIDGTKIRFTYELFKELLSKHGVVYIETME